MMINTGNTGLATSSTVLVRPKETCFIPVVPEAHSSQPQAIIDKWQNILNTLRLVANVPAALIMRVTESEIEVHAASNNKENVYTVGARESLGIGLYCESVMGKDEPLHVPDAASDKIWRDNPDIPLGMVAYYGTPVKWSDGKFFGTLCVLDTKANEFSPSIKDLVEILRHSIEADLALQQMLTELSAAKEDAEKSNEAKSEFLSVVSHELRTPLNPIIGLGELIKTRYQDPEIQHYAEIMCASANHLLALINDLLDMGRIERKQLKINKKVFPIQQVLNETIDMLRGKVEASGLSLVTPDALADYHMDSDPLRIQQILTNLVDNAIKFTPQGQIEISCYPLDEHIAISVTDTGIGIDPEQQANIFRTFTQVDSSLHRREGGLGLGLALCSDLARLLGGKITLKSKPGQGSCFTLLLPDNEKQSASPDLKVKKKKPTALVIEDDPFSATTLSLQLKSLGFDVSNARAGKTALDLLQSRRFDILLVDIRLPDMLGDEVCMQARQAGQKNEKSRIIAQTANATEEEKQRCLELGFDDYLTKPISINKLKRCVSAE